MRIRKRTVTTIETHQIVIVRWARGVALAWCPSCFKEVEVVTLEEAAHLAGVSLRTICCRVSADDLHSIEAGDGALLVCLDSLLK